jgi:energy-coupling factor transport system permease protein
MIRRLTFGQYRNKNSVVHKLDSRIKIIYVVVLGMLAFTIRTRFEITVFSLFILLLILLAKMDLRDLIKNLRPFYFIFIFTFLMYFLFSRNQLLLGTIYLWRFLILIIISLLLTYTTTVSYLITAIEKLSKSLKIFNIKPRNIAVMISVAVRFVPVMFINLEKTREAMLSRLVNFRKIKYLKLLVLLILEKMLKSASNLSDALHSRLYNENTKSSKIMRLGKNDYISIVVVIIFVLIIY